jgi:alkaline phosphatase
MVEEQIDYVKAVEAVVAWIESHDGWNDTLLILTADHESGLLWGPDDKLVLICADLNAARVAGVSEGAEVRLAKTDEAE